MVLLLKDNEKGVDGFCDEMKVAVVSGLIEIDKDSKKAKEKLDTDLLSTGIIFRLVNGIVHCNPDSFGNCCKRGYSVGT